MRHFLIAACLSVVASSSDAASAQNVEFIPSLIVGASEHAPVEAMLAASPVFVLTDQEARIFVGDVNGTKIRVYGSDGGFLYVIATNGAGPGEIKRVSTGYVSGAELWLADESNARLSIFDVKSGRYIDSHKLSGVRLLKRVLQVPNGFLFLSKRLNPDTGNYFMLHEFDLVLGAVTDSFGSFDDLWSINDVFRDEAGGIVPGNVCLTPSGELLYAPSLYSGVIFGFERHETNWKATRELNGHLQVDDPYSINDGNLEIRSESRGLFCLDDGRVLHFSMQWDKQKQLIAELFSSEGQWLESASVGGIVFPQREFWDFNVNVSAIDTHGRFFITDASESGYPRLRAGKLRWALLNAR